VIAGRIIKRLKGMEKTCIDCSAYLPIPHQEFSEFGICLNDEAFEPFVEELLEGSVPGSCEALLEEKKFVGERPVCSDFEESEIIEIDDDSPFGKELRRLGASGELTSETLERAILEERVRRIDWKTMPVDQYVKQLESKRSRERDAGISSLGAMIGFGNPLAFHALLRFLSSLPPPETIKEVHLKREILRYLGCWEDKSAVALFLVEELGRIHSNNTTRQWISDIFRFLEQCPLGGIREPLEAMLSEKRFSYRFRGKVMDVLLRP
jgi:hypothetical protein